MATKTWFTIKEIATLQDIRDEDNDLLEFDTRDEAENYFNKFTKKNQGLHTIAENKMNVPDEQ